MREIEVSTARLMGAREKICDLEAAIREFPQINVPLVHRFSRGLYAREMFVPKGTIFVGKIHRYENLSIISQGDITVLTEDGVKRIAAPYSFVAPPLTKRIGYAHEDTVWTTIHATNETDLDRLEEELILAEYPPLPTEAEILMLKEAVT